MGAAAAVRWPAETFSHLRFELFGFDTYALCSDGDLMEGVGAEAA